MFQRLWLFRVLVDRIALILFAVRAYPDKIFKGQSRRLDTETGFIRSDRTRLPTL
jgi:hypothetical protein